MTDVRWMPISDYEDYYEVSNTGLVRSIDRLVKNSHSEYIRKGQVLTPSLSNSGYLQVQLSIRQKTKPHYVHRLVAEAFIQNPDNLPQINHKDEDKTNNNVENLEWCSRKYNMNYGTFPQKRKEKALREMNAVGKSRRVYQYDYSGSLVNIYPSLHEVERSTGIKQDKISKSCRNKGGHRTCNGYVWSFEEMTKERIEKLLFYCPKPVVQLSLDGRFVNRFNTAKEAARFMGCNANGIQHCCRGMRKTCCGYKWKFAI